MGTPVHSTDVCSSRFVFQRMTAPCLGTLRSARPHASREPSVSRRWARFGVPACGPKRVLLRCRTCRRTSDASSLRGLPDGARFASVGVARGSPQWRSSGRTREPRLPPPIRVNGLWLRRSPRRLPSPCAYRSSRRPGSLAFSSASTRKRDRELLQCHRPSRHSACLRSSRRAPKSALLRAARRPRLRDRAKRRSLDDSPTRARLPGHAHRTGGVLPFEVTSA